MAICFLSHNGIGLGHVSRTTELCNYLYKLGKRPILFLPAKNNTETELTFTIVETKSIKTSFDPYRFRVEDQINSACKINGEKFFFEDTHPDNLKIDESVRKFLIVRPTSFDYLKYLNSRYWNYYESFMIADDPLSPTWPYTLEETKQIELWEKWFCIGPIYRTATAKGIQSVKKKYNWNKSIPIVVLFMGGGGQHLQSDDSNHFINESKKIIQKIRRLKPNNRFIFIKGPLYKGVANFPKYVEVVDFEPNIPELLNIASVAIIRPGFNSVWECIGAKTPFFFIEGKTYHEPIKEKMQQLAFYNLISLKNDYQEIINSKKFELAAKQIIKKWNGKPNDILLTQLESNILPDFKLLPSFSKKYNFNLSENLNTDLSFTNFFFFRIDDVMTLDQNVKFLLDLVAKHNIFTSLEVVPYFCSFKEEDLQIYDPLFKNIIISQHGYDHCIHIVNPDRARSEFSHLRPSENELKKLKKGKEILSKIFPIRYKNGFSAPFDSLPDWLENYWFKIGGQYFSTISEKYFFKHTTHVLAAIDIWDWDLNCLVCPSILSTKIKDHLHRYKSIGIVLHPQHFNSEECQCYILTLIEELKACGLNTNN